MTMTNKQILDRVGAIGDIHGESRNLRLALDFLTQAKVDYIMSVGDIVDGKTPEEVEECLELLQNYGVLTVAGNHERWILTGQNLGLPNATELKDLSEKSTTFIKKLPKIREFDTVLGKLLLCHGLGETDMAGVWPDDYGVALESNLQLLRLVKEERYSFIINGHTHCRMVRRFDPLTIINAGTLIDNRQYPGFFIASFQEKFVQFYDLREGQIITTDNYSINNIS